MELFGKESIRVIVVAIELAERDTDNRMVVGWRLAYQLAPNLDSR